MLEQKIKSVGTRSIGTDEKPFLRETTETYSLMLSNKDQLVIPMGYKTDFATVPRFLWALFPPHGRDELAFVVHDYLYDKNLYDRKFADDEMLKMQLSLGSTKTRAYIMYGAVRLFAGSYWRN